MGLTGFHAPRTYISKQAYGFVDNECWVKKKDGNERGFEFVGHGTLRYYGFNNNDNNNNNIGKKIKFERK